MDEVYYPHMRMATVLAATFVCGFALGAYFLRSSVISAGRSVRENRGYAFINPLLACEPAEYKDQKYETMRVAVERYIADAVKNGALVDGAFYMKSPGGGWTGVNENKQFVPASLYKIPILITYFELAEKTPELLEEKIDFNFPITAAKQYIPPSRMLVENETYTINELLERMVKYSDNDAETFLFHHISKKYFEDVFSDLGLPPPSVVHETKVTPKQFAFFLRVLYNASYLSRDYSERVLKLLAETDFNEGIRAGVPSSVKTAHKFGEFVETKGVAQSVELHDCGIVYASSPYIACIMTRSGNLESDKKALRDISKIIYNGQQAL